MQIFRSSVWCFLILLTLFTFFILFSLVFATNGLTGELRELLDLTTLPSDSKARLAEVDRRLDRIADIEEGILEKGGSISKAHVEGARKLEAEFERLRGSSPVDLGERLREEAAKAKALDVGKLDAEIQKLEAEIDTEQKRLAEKGFRGYNSPEARFKRGETLSPQELEYLKNRDKLNRLMYQRALAEQPPPQTKAKMQQARQERLARQAARPKVRQASPRARLGGPGIVGGFFPYLLGPIEKFVHTVAVKRISERVERKEEEMARRLEKSKEQLEQKLAAWLQEKGVKINNELGFVIYFIHENLPLSPDKQVEQIVKLLADQGVDLTPEEREKLKELVNEIRSATVRERELKKIHGPKPYEKDYQREGIEQQFPTRPSARRSIYFGQLYQPPPAWQRPWPR